MSDHAALKHQGVRARQSKVFWGLSGSQEPVQDSSQSLCLCGLRKFLQAARRRPLLNHASLGMQLTASKG